MGCLVVTWPSCQISQIQIQKGDLAGDLGDGDLPGGYLHQLHTSSCSQVSCFCINTNIIHNNTNTNISTNSSCPQVSIFCWELITADKKFSVGAPPSFAQNHEFGFQSNVNEWYFQRRLWALPDFDCWDRQSSTSDNHPGFYHPYQIIMIAMIIWKGYQHHCPDNHQDNHHHNYLTGVWDRISRSSSWQSDSLPRYSGNSGKSCVRI